jgi:hypothetical protein
VKLRCRIGLHRWARYLESDPDLQDRGATTEWHTRCRDCNRKLGSGTAWATVTFLIVFAAAIWCLAAGPPLLGAVLMIGAVSGLLWTAGAVLGGRFVRWLSMGR